MSPALQWWWRRGVLVVVVLWLVTWPLAQLVLPWRLAGGMPVVVLWYALVPMLAAVGVVLAGLTAIAVAGFLSWALASREELGWEETDEELQRMERERTR